MVAVEPPGRATLAAAAVPSRRCSVRRIAPPTMVFAGSVTWKGVVGNSSSAARPGATRTPRVVAEPGGQDGSVRRARRHGKAHDEVAAGFGEKALGGVRDGVGGDGVGGDVGGDGDVGVRDVGGDSHHKGGDREDAARRRRAEARVGDEVRKLGPQRALVLVLAAPVLAPAALMPARRVAHRDEEAAVRVGAVAEFDVLAAVAGEGLVHAADRQIEPTPRGEVAAGDGAEVVVVSAGEVGSAGHVALDPRRIEVAAEEGAERTPVVADRRRVDAARGSEAAEADGHGVRDGVVPRGVGRQQARFRNDVAVQEHHNAVPGCPHPGVARARGAESAAFLAQHADVEPAWRRSRRYSRTVVDHDDLEQVARIALPLKAGECAGQRVGGLEVGYHDAHRLRGHEALGGGRGKPAPGVVAEVVGRRLAAIQGFHAAIGRRARRWRPGAQVRAPSRCRTNQR